MVAFEVLSKICQQHGDELTGSAASTFPQVDPTTSVWVQHNSNVLVQMVAQVVNDTFLNVFGTPALLCNVLHFMGYMEPPRYFWMEEYL